MIDFSKVQPGNVLRITGEGAPGFAELGDYVRVTEVGRRRVTVEDRYGAIAEFVHEDGAARLELTNCTTFSVLSVSHESGRV